MVQDIASLAAKVTYNGAVNLRGTIENPHDRFPDVLNGNSRIYAGEGKWTHIGATAVERNLTALGLAGMVYLPWNGPDVGRFEKNGFETLCVTPLGREVGVYIAANFNELRFRNDPRSA